MSSRFTFPRIAAVALFGGLVVGGTTAAYTLSKARFTDGETATVSYASFTGNVDTVAGGARAPSRCPQCRDSYDIVYLDNPHRQRTGVRTNVAAQRGRPDPLVVADDSDAPPETGWGHARDYARDEEDAARIARDDRMAAYTRQIERSVAQTDGMHDFGPPPPPTPDGVVIHRGAQSPAQRAAQQDPASPNETPAAAN